MTIYLIVQDDNIDHITYQMKHHTSTPTLLVISPEQRFLLSPPTNMYIVTLMTLASMCVHYMQLFLRALYRQVTLHTSIFSDPCKVPYNILIVIVNELHTIKYACFKFLTCSIICLFKTSKHFVNCSCYTKGVLLMVLEIL